MNNSFNGNGKHADQLEPRASNPYLDALTGEQPPEIVDFEMNTYPYAKVVPSIMRVSRVSDETEEEERYRQHPSPWLRALSILVIAGMLLAIVLGVAAHFYG